MPRTTLFAWFGASEVPGTALFAWSVASQVPKTILFARLADLRGVSSREVDAK